MRSKDKLRQLGVRPSKERGQNFLIDPWALDQIIEFGRPGNAIQLVEIGPGLGALTKELLRFGKLSVIEVEHKFCENIGNLYPAIEIVEEDVRFVDFSRFGDKLTVFGNLPYSLSTDIIFHLLSQPRSIDRAVVLLQREFVERMGARPGSKEYGVLSINCQLLADLRLGPIFPGECFHPPTSVDSQLVELTLLKNARYELVDLLWFKRVVSAAFFKRRKMILNALKNASIVDPKLLQSALNECKISSTARAETIEIEQYVELSNRLFQDRIGA